MGRNVRTGMYMYSWKVHIPTPTYSACTHIHTVLFPTRLLTSEDECKWFWHQMIYFPGTINIVSTRLYCHIYNIHQQRVHSSSSSYAHQLTLCMLHSEAVKGSSSLSSRRLLISLWVTSRLFLCPELTDAPCPYYGGSVPPSPKWRLHSQGPHTLPFQGTRQVRRW